MSSESSDLNTKICEQIEYYFGDLNLNCDKFLQNEIKKDDGWVPLDLLLTFNRLKQLTTDKSAVVVALKDSKIVDVSEDGEKVRRNPAVPIPDKKEYFQDVNNRTVYIKGFPSEASLEDIFEYLKPHGVGRQITMQRNKEKLFKGSVLATFKKKESAEKFVESIKKYEDIITLDKLMLNDWIKERADDKERKKAEAAENGEKNKLRKQARDAELISKGVILHVYGLPTENVNFLVLEEFFNQYAPVEFAYYKKGSSKARIQFRFTTENSAVKALEKMNEAAAKETNGKIIFLQKEIQCKVLEGEEEKKYWEDFKQKKTDIADFGVHLIKGQVLHVSGLPTEKYMSLDLLKEFFNQYAPVAYAVYEQGSPEASLRFQSNDEDAAFKVLETIKDIAEKESDGKILFQGQKIHCKVLEGEEEEKYWEDFSKAKSAKRNLISQKLHSTVDRLRSLKGQVLHVSGLPFKIPSGTFAKYFRKYGPVSRIVCEMGSPEAYLRFGARHEGAAVKALEIIVEAAKETDGKIFFQGQEIQCKVFESLEEEKIWEGLHYKNTQDEDEDDFSVINDCEEVDIFENDEIAQHYANATAPEKKETTCGIM